MRQRLVRFAAPSASVAMLAAAAAGLLEGAAQGAGLPATLCASGASIVYAAPLGLLLSLAARGLWRAWRPFIVAPGRAAAQEGAAAQKGAAAQEGAAQERAAAKKRASASGGRAAIGGALLLGGAVYAALAAIALGAAGMAVAGLALGEPGAGAELDPLLVAAGLAGAAAALLAVSRPATAVLARAARAIGVRRPRSALVAALILAGALATAVWLGVVGPALARVDYDYAAYGWTALAVLLLGHVAAHRIRGRSVRLAAGGAALLLCLALVATATVARIQQPATLFDAWYGLPVGGLAIGFTYDIEDLRSGSLPADPAPRPRAGAAHPDILLVTIDTMRADQLRLYGGGAATPRIEEAARRGVTFDWAFAPSNNTRQSISSMMTGLSPARLRGRVVEFGLKLDPRHIVLAERLRAAGYTTAGFLCCPNHLGGRKKIGLDRGLESVDYSRSGARLVTRAEEWLYQTGAASRPRFAWVHLFEPHDWQRQSPAAGEPDAHAPSGAAARYRRSIERADRLLVPLLAALEANARPTLLVIASDHGEGLGDHEALHHASDLYNSQIRVPLIIVGPDLGPPRRVKAPVALLDLAPTLLDLAGFEPPGMPEMDGRSFAGLVRAGGSARAGDVYAVMVRDRSVSRTGRALVAGRHKLIAIDRRRPELYDLLADPHEARNLASEQPAVTADLVERLALRRRADEVPPF